MKANGKGSKRRPDDAKWLDTCTPIHALIDKWGRCFRCGEQVRPREQPEQTPEREKR